MVERINRLRANATSTCAPANLFKQPNSTLDLPSRLNKYASLTANFCLTFGEETDNCRLKPAEGIWSVWLVIQRRPISHVCLSIPMPLSLRNAEIVSSATGAMSFSQFRSIYYRCRCSSSYVASCARRPICLPRGCEEVSRICPDWMNRD